MIGKVIPMAISRNNNGRREYTVHVGQPLTENLRQTYYGFNSAYDDETRFMAVAVHPDSVSVWYLDDNGPSVRSLEAYLGLTGIPFAPVQVFELTTAVRPYKERTSEFHKARRMFVVLKDGRLLLAPSNLDQSHREWMSGFLSDEELNEAIALRTRGYFLNDCISFYRSDDCLEDVDLSDVRKVLETLDPERTIFRTINFGAFRSEVQPWIQPWPARLSYSVSEIAGMLGEPEPRA